MYVTTAPGTRPDLLETRLAAGLAGAVALLLLLLAVRPGTVLAQNQTTFTVTVAPKTSEHPFFGQGFGEGYVVDGVQGQTLTLTRGVTYTFQMQNVPSQHPFYITTSIVGAGAAEYSEGVTGNGAVNNETLTFTPSDTAPDSLYYNCTNHQYMGGAIVLTTGTATERHAGGGLPEAVELDQNYPNPFNPQTTIRFHVAEAGHVTLLAYDLQGRAVARLVYETMAPGSYSVAWEGTDDAGLPLPSGTYLYRITTGGTSDTRVMTLLR